jgi:hypothetical protein
MAITNGYATLNEARERLLKAGTYTAATISFAAGTKTIADTKNGLRRFQDNAKIRITGSASNNGDYTVATGGVAASIVTSEALVNEVAGSSVTIVDITNIDNDVMIESMVEAVSRAIDAHCKRRFYVVAGETRYFQALRPDFCPIDDLSAITSLATDQDGDRTYETTWSASDYDLEPANAAAEGRPWMRVRPTPRGSYDFPSHAKGVKIVGSFGYASTAPPEVKEACLLQVARLYLREKAPFGVTGSADLGQLQVIPTLDPDVKLLLKGMRRLSA